MRRYRARKAAERAELLAQAERREPNIEAMLTQILEAVTALSEGVARMETALTRSVNELTETNVKPILLAGRQDVSKLTKANVNKGKPTAERQVRRGRVNVKANELTKDNVSKGKQPSPSSTAEQLAREAQALHAQGLSYDRIAKRWTEAGIPALKGGRWHKGTIAKMVQRHAGQ
jgi:cytoskeletal protein RodZ